MFLCVYVTYSVDCRGKHQVIMSCRILLEVMGKLFSYMWHDGEVLLKVHVYEGAHFLLLYYTQSQKKHFFGRPNGTKHQCIWQGTAKIARRFNRNSTVYRQVCLQSCSFLYLFCLYRSWSRGDNTFGSVRPRGGFFPDFFIFSLGNRMAKRQHVALIQVQISDFPNWPKNGCFAW